MDAIDITSPDFDILEDSDQTEDTSFGREVTKTLIVSTATSAAVFGGLVVIPMAASSVKRWYDRKKNPVVIEGEVVSTTDTTEKN